MIPFDDCVNCVNYMQLNPCKSIIKTNLVYCCLLFQHDKSQAKQPWEGKDDRFTFFNVCLDALSVVSLNDVHPFNRALPFTKLKYKVLS